MNDPRAWPGSVRVFAEYDRDLHVSADVVVVGSGPCGAVAAYELAAAGKSVVLCEEGPPFTPADYEIDGADDAPAVVYIPGFTAHSVDVLSTLLRGCFERAG